MSGSSHALYRGMRANGQVVIGTASARRRRTQAPRPPRRAACALGVQPRERGVVQRASAPATARASSPRSRSARAPRRAPHRSPPSTPPASPRRAACPRARRAAPGRRRQRAAGRMPRPAPTPPARPGGPAAASSCASSAASRLMRANARLYSWRVPSSDSTSSLPRRAAAAASPAASSASIRLPDGDGRMAAALPVQRQQAAAAVQRVGGVAAHAGDPLRGLGAPEQALRRPCRVFEPLQLVEQRPRRRQVAGLRRGARRAGQRVVQRRSGRPARRVQPSRQAQAPARPRWRARAFCESASTQLSSIQACNCSGSGRSGVDARLAGVGQRHALGVQRRRQRAQHASCRCAAPARPRPLRGPSAGRRAHCRGRARAGAASRRRRRGR